MVTPRQIAQTAAPVSTLILVLQRVCRARPAPTNPHQVCHRASVVSRAHTSLSLVETCLPTAQTAVLELTSKAKVEIVHKTVVIVNREHSLQYMVLAVHQCAQTVPLDHTPMCPDQYHA